MKSNNSAGKRLFDLLELQTEILEQSLREDNFAKYVRVRNTVSDFLHTIIGVSKKDFDRFKRIIDLKNDEEKELFEDIKFDRQELYPYVTNTNKVIPFLIDFYLKGILNAFRTSDVRKFQIFYIDINRLFSEITSFGYREYEVRRNIFGEEYNSPNLKTKFFLDESITAYFEYISTGRGFNLDDKTNQQIFIKFSVLFQLHKEYFFKDDFELTLTQETLNLIERIIVEQIIDKDDLETFGWICSTLHSIADERYSRWGELKGKVSQKKQNAVSSLIDEARSIITIDQFSAFEEKLDKLLPSENQSVEDIRMLAVFSLKYALFRYMFIRIGATLIAKEKHDMVYELLFTRQPLEVDYINSNYDFFPTEIEDVTHILANLDKLSYTRFGRFEKKPLNKQRDQFILLWLFRNYIWEEQQQGYKHNFALTDVNKGSEVERLKKLFIKFLDLIEEGKSNSIDLLTFQKRIPVERVLEFQTEVSKIKDEIVDNHLQKIKDAILENDKVRDFKIRVVGILNAQKSLTNFFLQRQGQDFKLADNPFPDGNIRNIQLYDKGPFINSSLPFISSINADSVYPEVMGKNLSLESDSFLFRKIAANCEEKYLTLKELDEKLLYTSFKNKTLLSHYIHLGFELLKDRFNYSIGKKIHEGTFNDSEGIETEVYSFYSYSQMKFVIVFDNSKLDDLITVSKVKIEEKEYQEDRLKVLFEGAFNLSVKESDGKDLGTIYYLR